MSGDPRRSWIETMREASQSIYTYRTPKLENSDCCDLELLSDSISRPRRNINPNLDQSTPASYAEKNHPIPIIQPADHLIPENGLPKLNSSIFASANKSQQNSISPKKINAYTLTSATADTTAGSPTSSKQNSINSNGTYCRYRPIDYSVIVAPMMTSSSDPYNHTFNFDARMNESLKKHNISEKKEDYHVYYNSTRTEDVETGQRYWVDFTNKSGVVLHPTLSQSHRRAVTVPLPFKFQFYGHEIENVTIATGGFLYTGDYIHSWLAATQYIAPLMANFDTSLLNDSYIKYASNDTAFTVLWENVSLQDRPLAGNFTFEATLYKNGDIVFVYKHVPNITKEITEDFHPVKVGLSDAYIMDRTIFFSRRKTIFEYHRVHFDKKDLKNWTVIYFKPLTTCLKKTTCESCLAKDIPFDCQWCDNRCSDGIDRKKDDWEKRDCDKRKINETKFCSVINEKVPIPGAHKAMNFGDISHGSKNSSSAIFLVIIMLGGVFSALLWTVYAYRNPHSTSGQILIKYRPSQWNSWRKGEARYTAATIHM
ncbi:hypothetical protein V9T40_007910 [Parthenolecanium corni]|uniref:PSI domain-containing protein n=1 Tax=Parthenolecanium corni TaxID=536013 RepID=A0AAN9TQG0_9HEMI